jgi:hypothetical protein
MIITVILLLIMIQLATYLQLQAIKDQSFQVISGGYTYIIYIRLVKNLCYTACPSKTSTP